MCAKKRIPVASTRLKLLDEHGTEGVLLGTMCRRCGEHFFGHVVFCQNCSSRELDTVELTNHGTLYSYTIVRVPPAGWPGDVPYVLGQVELPEGPHVLSEVIDCPYEQLKVGMELKLALVVGAEDDEGRDVIVYKWRKRRPESS